MALDGFQMFTFQGGGSAAPPDTSNEEADSSRETQLPNILWDSFLATVSGEDSAQRRGATGSDSIKKYQTTVVCDMIATYISLISLV